MRVKPVAAGLHTDVEKLMNAFSDTNSVRFDEFAKQWKSLKFSFIFMGRENEGELREFINECYRTALLYMTSNNRFQARVGGLYFLYSVYVKQPMNLHCRIRVTMQQWETVNAVADTAMKENHLDACYIWNCLLLDKAFQFVFYPLRLGPLTTTLGEVVEIEASKHFDEISLPFQSFLEENYLEQLSAVHEQYEKMKEVQPDLASLTLVTNNIFPDILMKARELKLKYSSNKLDNISGQASVSALEDAQSGNDVDSSEDEQSSDIPEGQVEDIGSRRTSLRNKLYKALVTPTQSRRHRKTEKVEENTASRKRDGRPPYAIRRNPRKKARTHTSEIAHTVSSRDAGSSSNPVTSSESVPQTSRCNQPRENRS